MDVEMIMETMIFVTLILIWWMEIGGGVHFSELDLATANEKGASWSKTPSGYLLTLAMIMMMIITTSATMATIISIIIIVIIIIMHNNLTNLLVDIESSEWIIC